MKDSDKKKAEEILCNLFCAKSINELLKHEKPFKPYKILKAMEGYAQLRQKRPRVTDKIIKEKAMDILDDLIDETSEMNGIPIAITLKAAYDTAKWLRDKYEGK
jgi:hypothetical protein